MRRLVLERYGKYPKVVTEALPVLKPDHFIVRMKYSPINPSDYSFFFGRYGIKRETPTYLGFEGSGIIQSAQDKNLIGKKVSVIVPNDSVQGTYSTHLLIRRQWVNIFADNDDLKQLACSNVNPLTVVSFRNIVKKAKVKNILISAGGSQLSRMIGKHFSKNKVGNLMTVVRKKEAVNQLLDIGYNKVFLDSEFDDQTIKKIGSCVFFDALGGERSATIFNSLASNSKMVVYGVLSGQGSGNINFKQSLFKNKQLGSFWLNSVMESVTPQQFKLMKQQVVQNKQNFGVKIGKQFQMQNYKQALRQAMNHDNSSGKTLLRL